MRSNYLCFILVALLSCAITQKITLKDFSYTHSKTYCTNVLISGYDVVEFTCLVDYSQAPDVNYVIFETKRATESRFSFLTDCNIKEGCKDSQHAHGTHIRKYIIEITIRVNATSSLNGAKLRGLLYTPDNKAIFSSEKIFPQITDFPTAEGKFIINGKTITPPTECHEFIQRPELNLVFLCESQGLPCLIEISTDGSNETSEGRGHVTWNKEYSSQSEVNVLIKYAVCNLNGISKSVSCKFNFEYNSTTIENDGNNNPSRSGLYFLALMMVIILCLLLLQFKKQISQCFWSIRRLENFKVSSECLHEADVLFLNPKTPDDELSTETYIDPDIKTNSNNKTARRRRPVEDKVCTETQNLMNDFTSCQKKEKHGSFIPIDKLIIEDLPTNYFKSDLFDLIKCISELTVMVTVNYISKKRPAFYPGTQYTYPFHEKRGTYLVRIGTGFVKGVIQKENGKRCPCYKCLHSGNASKVWGKICIATTKSLVFDNSEAQKTIFKINCNEENRIYHCVEGLRVTQSDIDTEKSEVECVTCDEGLLNMLYLKPNKCMRKLALINSKYNTIKDKEKLTIIVSHPHGCPKHVSIGHWTKRFVVGHDGSRQYTQYVYSTPTCPGCIGAFVYIVGVSDITLTYHIHCGVNKETDNLCNTGMEKICTETL